MPVDFVIWVVSLASIACVLFRPRGIAEAWWACAGALILVVFALIPLSLAGGAILKCVDVCLFLTGMMILSELAREKGVFDWIAEIAAAHTAGSPRRLLLLVYLSGTVVTAFLSNDATAVVMTPAVLTVVRRLKVEPIPHLLACAFIANAASFLLPISNPANLVVFGGSMPPLLKWVRIFLAPSLASILITYAALRFISRKGLEGSITECLSKTRLSAEGRLALGGLILAAVGLVSASALGWTLGAPTCLAALLAAAVVCFSDRSIAVKVAKGVSWSIIPLVAGLFVMVEALQRAGMLRLAVLGLRAAAGLGGTSSNIAAAFGAGLLSNCMNNLPVGLISGTAVQAAQAHANLAQALLVGVDLGPNLSVTGSLATILWLIALRRENVAITGWQFLKVGLVVMPAALLASILVLKG